MSRLWRPGAALFKVQLTVALALVSLIAARPARADEATCAITDVNMVTPDKGAVTINCSGLSEAFGRQFADILTRILKDRLDPQTVMAKLDEVERIPQEGVARTVDETQRQLLIQSLHGKPPGQIAITAHPAVEDSAVFAKDIATPLLQVGWQIEGQQIRRAAPPALEPVPGLAVVVRDKDAPPQPALELRAALASAHIPTALVADPSLGPDATLLWVGRRPGFTSTEAAK